MCRDACCGTQATPFNGNTNANGQFNVTFSSPNAGQVIGTATTTVLVGGVPLTRTTDGSAVGGGQSNSGPATKIFGDAKIIIAPDDDTNEVGDPHTFTTTVFVDDGSGTDLDGVMGTVRLCAERASTHAGNSSFRRIARKAQPFFLLHTKNSVPLFGSASCHELRWVPR